ncbi:MAG: carboxypeptidase regulatory-like domain-containing protein, partial [Elusimicrobia bacterium]|nr:carboxypeptidase regulatory-like domain-containing protein [Elusimicrobiota bacterium]
VYYQTDSPAGVKHARLAGAAWSTNTVEDFVSTATFVSIAVGSDSDPRVVYSQTVDSRTRYGEWSGNVWVTTDVFDFDFVGGPLALALDTDNTPHGLSVGDLFGTRYVVFFKKEQGGMFLADVLGWSVDPIVETQKMGLAVDRQGKAHMSFFDENEGGLVYALFDGAHVSSSTLDVSPGAGVHSDIAVNSQNFPMIVYLSAGIGVRAAVFGGASWSLSTLEAGAQNGVGPSVVFNRYNHFLASYLNGDSNELKFLTDAPRDLSISGTVLDFGGSPIPGASVTLSGGIASTVLTVSEINGGYAAEHLFEGSYTLTPAKGGYVFQPTTLSFSPLRESQSLQNFQGGPVSFSPQGNLFNPAAGEQVTFNYSVVPGHVSLKIYSLKGTPVRTLVDQDEPAGTYSVHWDGRDADGHTVASGIYLVYFEADQTQSTTKVVVVK